MSERDIAETMDEMWVALVIEGAEGLTRKELIARTFGGNSRKCVALARLKEQGYVESKPATGVASRLHARRVFPPVGDWTNFEGPEGSRKVPDGKGGA